jgi:uncharacterized protein (TIGR02598 family)
MKAVLPRQINSFRDRRAGFIRQGFSLIEVALAIAVIAIAMVTLIGLIPAGMSVFQKANATSAATQIFEKVLADARQTDFSKLVYPDARQSDTPAIEGRVFREPKLRYFDADGEEIVPKSGAQPSAEELEKIIYHVSTRIVTNARVPSDQPNHVSQYLATLTVQIAANPGNLPLSFDGDQFLVPLRGMQIRTLSAQLAKND